MGDIKNKMREQATVFRSCDETGDEDLVSRAGRLKHRGPLQCFRAGPLYTFEKVNILAGLHCIMRKRCVK